MILVYFFSITYSHIVILYVFIPERKVGIAMLVNGSMVECMVVVSTKLTNASHL